ncbi:MAG: hypothetical protein KBS75_09170 [Bacteroidales bacterium]|nr:hypothetical protein [Candidatus Equimonas faecalis]
MTEHQIKIIIAVFAVLALFIKIPKVELPIWRWILEGIGKSINAPLSAKIAELSAQISNVDKLLNEHIKTQEEAEITACRRRILRFWDEVMMGVRHSQEHWNNIMEDVDGYHTYCESHPNYHNSKATRAMSLLTDKFNELTPQDFLKEDNT